MKKDISALICLGLAAAALLAAFVLLRRSGGAARQTPMEEAGDSEAPKVYQLPEPVRSINIRQAGREAFTLLNLAEASSGDIASALAGREDLPADVLRINSILRAAQSLSYVELLFESLEDGAPFGIDNPRAIVEIADMGGRGVTLLIGDTAPGNVGIYLKTKGEDCLYLVPEYMLDAYLLPEADFMSHAITPDFAAMDFSRVILGGRVRREQGEVEIAPGKEPGSFRITAPESHGLDPYAGAAALRSLFGMQAARVEAIYPSESELAALGLDDPYASVRVEGGGDGGFSLRISEPDSDGTAYIIREDIPLLYSAAADGLPWLRLQFYELMDKTAHAPDMEELSGILIETPERAWSFAVSQGAEGPEASLDGKALDAEGFGAFCRLLASAELTEPAGESAPPKGEAPAVRLAATYRYRTGEAHTVTFYEGPPRRCYIRADEGGYYLTPSLYAERLLEELNALTQRDR